MRLLCDTHALLWWLFDDKSLSRRARGLLGDPHNEVLISAASAWEISTKHRLGKLPAAAVLVQDIAGWIARAGFVELRVSVIHAQRAGGFPHPHRDPFDRMLAAQSLVEAVPLITNDRVFPAFGVEVVW